MGQIQCCRVESLLSDANQYLSIHRYDDAIHAYDEVISMKPSCKMAWNNRGFALASLGRYDESIVCFQRALSIDARYKEAWNNNGCSLRDVCRFEEALTCFQSALSVDPTYRNAWCNLGHVFALMGRKVEGIECFDHVLSDIDRHDIHSLCYKGEVLMDVCRRVEALECFERCVEEADLLLAKTPKNEVMWRRKGASLLGLNRVSEALVCFDEATLLFPSSWMSWMHKGDCYRSLGRPVEALSCYDRSLSSSGQRTYFASLGRARVLCSLSRLQEASEEIAHAIELNPRDEKSQICRGQIFFASNFSEQAIECFSRAVEMNHRCIEAWECKRAVLLQLGRNVESEFCREQATLMDPLYESSWVKEACFFGVHPSDQSVEVIPIQDGNFVERALDASLSQADTMLETAWSGPPPPENSNEIEFDLYSSVEDFIKFAQVRKKWSHSTTQNLLDMMEEQEIFSVESILECWTHCIEDERKIGKSLKVQLRSLLLDTFSTDVEIHSRFPQFFALSSSISEKHVSGSSVDLPHHENVSSECLSSTLQPSSSSIFQGYKILRKLYEGTENSVFEVIHLDSKASFALKVYRSRLSRDTESEVLDSLPHSDYIVVKRTSFSLPADVQHDLFLSADHCAGCIFELGCSSLEKEALLFRSGERRSKFRTWLRDAALAIEFLHAHGLVHCDIKPSNFLFFSHFLKLIDFESCRKVGDIVLKNDSAPGTPMFASRRVLHHNKEHRNNLVIDTYIDIQSFGYLVFFVLTGIPFPVAGSLMIQEQLDHDASMIDVADICFHPDFNEYKVLQEYVASGHVNEQEASLIKKALASECSMQDLLLHPYFGVRLSDTEFRQQVSLSDHGQLLSNLQLHVEDIQLSMSYPVSSI